MEEIYPPSNIQFDPPGQFKHHDLELSSNYDSPIDMSYGNGGSNGYRSHYSEDNAMLSQTKTMKRTASSPNTSQYYPSKSDTLSKAPYNGPLPPLSPSPPPVPQSQLAPIVMAAVAVADAPSHSPSHPLSSHKMPLPHSLPPPPLTQQSRMPMHNSAPPRSNMYYQNNSYPKYACTHPGCSMTSAPVMSSGVMPTSIPSQTSKSSCSYKPMQPSYSYGSYSNLTSTAHHTYPSAPPPPTGYSYGASSPHPPMGPASHHGYSYPPPSEKDKLDKEKAEPPRPKDTNNERDDDDEDDEKDDDESDSEERESEEDNDDMDSTPLLLRKDSSAFSSSSNSSVEERMSNGSVERRPGPRKRKSNDEDEPDSDSKDPSKKKMKKKNHSSHPMGPSTTGGKSHDAKTSQMHTGDDRIDKPFQCEKCGKRFRRRTNLQVHERVHSDDRPFPCEFQNCGKSFKRKHGLKAHIRTHTGYKPFECDHCGRKFSDSGNYKRHAKSQHQVKVEIGRGPRKPDPPMSAAVSAGKKVEKRVKKTTPLQPSMPPPPMMPMPQGHPHPQMHPVPEMNANGMPVYPPPMATFSNYAVGSVPFQTPHDFARPFPEKDPMEIPLEDYNASYPAPVVNSAYPETGGEGNAGDDSAMPLELEHEETDTKKNRDHMLRSGMDPANIVASSMDNAAAISEGFALAPGAFPSAAAPPVMPIHPPMDHMMPSQEPYHMFRPQTMAPPPHEEHYFTDYSSMMPGPFAPHALVPMYPPNMHFIAQAPHLMGFPLPNDAMYMMEERHAGGGSAPNSLPNTPREAALASITPAVMAPVVKSEVVEEDSDSENDRNKKKKQQRGPTDSDHSNGSSKNHDNQGGNGGAGGSAGGSSGGRGNEGGSGSSDRSAGSGSGSGSGSGASSSGSSSGSSGAGGGNRDDQGNDEDKRRSSAPTDNVKKEEEEEEKVSVKTEAVDSTSTSDDAVKTEAPLGTEVVDEGECAVCFDGESTDDNPIVFCGKCDVAVHQGCYGIEHIPEGDWICSKCEYLAERKSPLRSLPFSASSILLAASA